MSTLGIADSIWAFSLAVLRINWRDRRLLRAALVPVVLLIALWIAARSGGPTGEFLVGYSFPGLISFSVLQAGSTHALRIIAWQERDVFRRFSCTPIPLGWLVLAEGLAQLVVGLAQGGAMLLFGALLGLPIQWSGLIPAVGVLALGSACFVSYGSLIASLSGSIETANLLFNLTLVPMAILSTLFVPASQLPPPLNAVSPWLPPSMIADLVRPLLTGAALTNPWFSISGLLAYTLLFTIGSFRGFRQI